MTWKYREESKLRDFVNYWSETRRDRIYFYIGYASYWLQDAFAARPVLFLLMVVAGILIVGFLVVVPSAREQVLIELIGGSVIATALLVIDGRRRTEAALRQNRLSTLSAHLAALSLTLPLGRLETLLDIFHGTKRAHPGGSFSYEVTRLSGILGLLRRVVATDQSGFTGLSAAAKDAAQAVDERLYLVEPALLNVSVATDHRKVAGGIHELRQALQASIGSEEAAEILEQTCGWLETLRDLVAMYERDFGSLGS